MSSFDLCFVVLQQLRPGPGGGASRVEASFKGRQQREYGTPLTGDAALIPRCKPGESSGRGGGRIRRKEFSGDNWRVTGGRG